MSNILVKKNNDQLICRSLYTSVEPILVGSSQKRGSCPVELCLNDEILVTCTRIYLILKLSCG